jgi:hypothetical protein
MPFRMPLLVNFPIPFRIPLLIPFRLGGASGMPPSLHNAHMRMEKPDEFLVL